VELGDYVKGRGKKLSFWLQVFVLSIFFWKNGMYLFK
jgi:hypothetical protein